jgi:hypothetical protein
MVLKMAHTLAFLTVLKKVSVSNPDTNYPLLVDMVL